MNYYSYEELVSKALSPAATQEDVNELGEWFQQHGMMYWNGECFTIDSKRDLYPIYKEVDEDEFEVVGYEVR